MPRGHRFASCRRGHALTAENTVTNGDTRTCRTCRVVSNKRANDARPRDYYKSHRDPVNAQWHSYHRFRTFDLPRALFVDLVTDNCFYCGAAPQPVNGIDRVDNSRHYTADNVVTACAACNQAKHTMSREQFESWGSRLGRHLARHAPAA